MKCRKCDEEFEEDRNVFPPDICPKCKKKNFNCTLKRPIEQQSSRGSAIRYSPRFQEKQEVGVCGREFSGEDLDPTEGIAGLDYCPSCRNRFVCHTCHKSESQVTHNYKVKQEGFELQQCKSCGKTRPFCQAHKFERRGRNCKRPSEKVPPSSFDPIQFTPLSLSLLSCQQIARKKPLFLNETQYINPDLTKQGLKTEFNVNEAKSFTRSIFNHLLLLLFKLIGKRKDYELPDSQNTMAITLLENEEHFRIILTYSDYDRTHVATPIKSEHESFKLMVVEADPAVFYHKGSQTHYLFDLNSPCKYDGYKDHSGSIPGYASEYVKDNRRFIQTYPLNDRNDHHAEMRAFMFARKRKYNIVLLLPTKECCDKCYHSLSEGELVHTVPPVLQFNRQTLFEDGNKVIDYSTKKSFGIVSVPGGGNCLFSALIQYKLPGLPKTEAEMRQVIAERISSSGILGAELIAGRVMRTDSYIDTQDLAAIGTVIERRIVLYEGHYGATRWHTRSSNGKPGDKPLYILLRSVENQPEGHYDPLIKRK